MYANDKNLRLNHTCVIGGGGFIGRSLVEQLKRTGRKVTVIGRKNNSVFTGEVTYLHSESNRPGLFFDDLKDVDEVIDLSYTTTPQTSFADPIKDIIDNLQVTVELFEKLCNCNVKKLVYVSSGGTVYGQAVSAPISEEHPTNPVSPYGITKLAIEKYGKMYHDTRQLPIIIVRPANAYGEGQQPFMGQGFIPTAIATVLQGKKIRIYGEKGTVRDYIHSSDVAGGIIAALDHGAIGACYNIGTGIGRTNFEVVESIASLMEPIGHHCEIEYLPHRSFDVKTNILDSTKLHSISGWTPKMEFNKGLEATIGWAIAKK